MKSFSGFSKRFLLLTVRITLRFCRFILILLYHMHYLDICEYIDSIVKQGIIDQLYKKLYITLSKKLYVTLNERMRVFLSPMMLNRCFWLL